MILSDCTMNIMFVRYFYSNESELWGWCGAQKYKFKPWPLKSKRDFSEVRPGNNVSCSRTLHLLRKQCIHLTMRAGYFGKTLIFKAASPDGCERLKKFVAHFGTCPSQLPRRTSSLIVRDKSRSCPPHLLSRLITQHRLAEEQRRKPIILKRTVLCWLLTRKLLVVYLLL